MKPAIMKNLPPKLDTIEFKPAGLVEQVSDVLTEAILEGWFEGGDQLTELVLQRQFNISRTPIRESFHVLEKKGLVELIPRKGAFVKRIRPQDIRENFPVRAVLEGLAAKLAHPQMTPRMLETMEGALEGMKLAAENQDAKIYWKEHILFHETFIGACGNQLLINSLKTLRMQIMWYRLSYQYYQEEFESSYNIHEVIMGLFREKKSDLDVLESAVRRHIEIAVDKFLGYLARKDKLKPVS